MFEMNIDPKKFVLDWMASEAFIPLNKYTAHRIGLNEALLLAETLNQYKRWERLGKLTERDEFYWNVEDCQEQTTFSPDQQKRVFKSLENKRLLKRFPRQIKKGETKTSRFIRINFDNIPPVLFDDEEAAAERQRKAAERKAKQKIYNLKRKNSEGAKPPAPGTARDEGGEGAKPTFLEGAKPPGQEGAKPPASNKESFINKYLEEEEEGAAAIINFLVNKNHEKSEAKKFAARVRKLGVTGYTDEQMLKAINDTHADIDAGRIKNIGEPYKYAAGKLEIMLKTPASEPQPKKTSSRSSKETRSEMVPEWMNEDKQQQDEPQEPETDAELKERMRKIEENLKKLKNR